MRREVAHCLASSATFESIDAVRFRLARVCALLFGSGSCALVYQTAWFRELRLIFGASTAASAAVLAVFMAGLGIGGIYFGKRADRSKNPLAMYANLELAVAVAAAITPGFVWLADAAYIASGGISTLGNTGALLFRLVLSVIVLGPATLLMGGTLPAAAKAVERASDGARKSVAALYGFNTFGAVAGAIAANFFLVEVFGVRMTLWLACLVNLLVGVIGRSLSRSPEVEHEPTPEEADALALEAARDAREAREAAAATDGTATPLAAKFPPAAAAITGATFMLMELIWYRMLSPILGGSSYTFGLILAVALIGIGLGSAVYARMRLRPTLATFAATCALEALVIIIPYALGDRIALLAWLLRPMSVTGFGASVLAWSVVASIVVLPTAIISGAQFPMLIGLYGRGDTRVGRDIGSAYLANTIGAIVGSIAGGFGLLPLLSAPSCWQMVVVLLLLTSGAALVLDVRVRGRWTLRRSASRAAVAAAIAAIILLGSEGPTAFWRHSGIGAGRADRRLENLSTAAVLAFERSQQNALLWEEDGLESVVGLSLGEGYAFIVNGKSDGHSIIDAPTQVMSGVLGALLHPNPKRSLVVGLGTGSTAGWLAVLPTMEKVDVVELEPSILRVARDCAPVNRDVMNNPKVTTQLGDARETLRTTREKYDVIFSEPSNPYRAGISSMYTQEFYRAASERLLPGGLFVQWMQAYEVDGWAVATTINTVRTVFAYSSLWKTMGGDFILISQMEAPTFDVGQVRERLQQPEYRAAAGAAWQTLTAEGVLFHFVANPKLADTIVKYELGALNRDDQNVLEFAFARFVGRHSSVDADFTKLAERLRVDMPAMKNGTIDHDLLIEERWLQQAENGRALDPPASPSMSTEVQQFGEFLRLMSAHLFKPALVEWRRLGRPARAFLEAALVAEAAAYAGDPEGMALIDRTPDAGERDVFRAIWASRRHDNPGAAKYLDAAFTNHQKNPWLRGKVGTAGLELAYQLSLHDHAAGRTLFATLGKPFAVEALRDARLWARARVGQTIDPQHCSEALHALEPAPWSAPILEARLTCYTATKDPHLPEAKADVLKMASLNGTFGGGLPSAPPDAAQAPSSKAPQDPPPTTTAPAKNPEADAGTGARDAADGL